MTKLLFAFGIILMVVMITKKINYAKYESKEQYVSPGILPAKTFVEISSLETWKKDKPHFVKNSAVSTILHRRISLHPCPELGLN